MKRKKNKMKKRISLIVAAVLAVGSAVPLADYVMELRAASREPDVKYFAEKDEFDQLEMGRSDATRIRFGQQGGAAGFAEWYMVDTDENIKDDEGNLRPNVILFSAQSLGNSTVYQNQTGEEVDLLKRHGTYPDRAATDTEDAWDSATAANAKYEKVYANHYGASTLRASLETLANGSLFSDVKELILPTDLKLADARNSDTYTVEKQLFYVPASDGTNMYFGSSFDVGVSSNNVAALETGDMWTTLKAPETHTDLKNVSYVLEKKADGSVGAEQKQVTEQQGVYPAFALDLSQVVFGSVVDRVTGGTTADTVGEIDTSQKHSMLLRLNGDLRNSGGRAVDVAYNNSQISYKNAPSGSRIIVQGKGLPDINDLDGREWYWISGALDTKNTINSTTVAQVVASKLGVSGYTGNLDLSTCKIWLEDTANSMGGMPYAYEAHKGEITKIVLDGFAEPAGGQQLPKSAQVADGVGETRGIAQSTVDISWTDNTTNTTNVQVGEYGHEYTATIRVSRDNGYSWTLSNEQLANNIIIKQADGSELKYDSVRITGGEADDSTPEYRTLIITFTIPPNPVIDYQVLLDNNKVVYDSSTGDPAQEIKWVYDGKAHDIEVITNTSGVRSPISSFEPAVDDDTSQWKQGSQKIEDAGTYTIYFKISATDGLHNTVDATTDESEVKPLKVTVEKRQVLINPESQEIPWTKDLAINQTLYKEVIGNQSIDPNAGALVKGHEIVGLTLTPEMGAVINKDGIISEGWIWFYPTKKDDDGNEVLSYTVWDREHDRDVSENYDIQQGAAGKLTILHNENLPPDSITVEKAKTTYKLGEALMVNDLKVTARYGDGYVEQVPRGDGHDSLTTNESDIDMTTLGGKALKVTYTREEPEPARGSASESLTINVVEEQANNSNNSNNAATPTGSSTTPGTSTRAANNTSSGSGSGSGTSGGSSSGSGTTSTANKSTTTPGARTGDTNPIAMWVITALCSGIAVVSLMIFSVSRNTKKKKVRSKKHS